jgi:hypothetical protein
MIQRPTHNKEDVYLLKRWREAITSAVDSLIAGGGGGGGSVSDTAYGVGWNGVTTIAPSKNAVYDKIESLSTNVDGGSASSVGVASLAIDGGTA